MGIVTPLQYAPSIRHVDQTIRPRLRQLCGSASHVRFPSPLNFAAFSPVVALLQLEPFILNMPMKARVSISVSLLSKDIMLTKSVMSMMMTKEKLS